MINDNQNPDELFRSAFENEKVAFDESSWEKVLPLLAKRKKKRRGFFWIFPAGLLLLISTGIWGFYALDENRAEKSFADENQLAENSTNANNYNAKQRSSNSNPEHPTADDENGNESKKNKTDSEGNLSELKENINSNQAKNTTNALNQNGVKKDKKNKEKGKKSAEKNKKKKGDDKNQKEGNEGTKAKRSSATTSTGNTTLDSYLVDKSNVTPIKMLGFRLFPNNPNLSLKKNSLSDENNTDKKDNKKKQSEPAYVANYLALGVGSFQNQTGLGFMNFQVYQQKERKHLITGIGLGVEYNRLPILKQQYVDTSFGFGAIINDVTINELAQFNLQLPLILGYRLNNNHQIKAIFEPTLSFAQHLEINSFAVGPLDQATSSNQTDNGWQYNTAFRPQFKLAYQYRIYKKWHAGVGIQQGLNPQSSAYFFNLNYQFR